MSCARCGGELVALGQLGKLMWTRCRSCGSDHSIEDCTDDGISVEAAMELEQQERDDQRDFEYDKMMDPTEED